jgi:ubiquinone/menaquinone biosynthesis C-methylase UbiE
MKRSFMQQFKNPSGFIGQIVGKILAIDNNQRSLWTVEKLQVKPTDSILEIGYGPGVTMKLVTDRLTSGFVAGVDHSKVMFRQASKRNQKHIASKKVKLETGTIADLTYPENSFDLIYGSNIHFFWKEPVAEFQKLFSLLKPSGRLVVVFQPRWAKSEEEIRDIAIKTKKQFEAAGFKQIEVEFKQLKPVTCIYISGIK